MGETRLELRPYNVVRFHANQMLRENPSFWQNKRCIEHQTTTKDSFPIECKSGSGTVIEHSHKGSFSGTSFTPSLI